MRSLVRTGSIDGDQEIPCLPRWRFILALICDALVAVIWTLIAKVAVQKPEGGEALTGAVGPGLRQLECRAQEPSELHPVGRRSQDGARHQRGEHPEAQSGGPAAPWRSKQGQRVAWQILLRCHGWRESVGREGSRPPAQYYAR
mmetsp:Transcript_124783/g.347453  ORF Transcript_124783/g.347453 Transcript_124783/m.347453 type:complete len:144 (-) Transcript_124783:14-445(-)